MDGRAATGRAGGANPLFGGHGPMAPWLALMPAGPCGPRPAADPWALWTAALDPARNPWLALGLAFGPLGWLAAMAPRGDAATEQLVEDMPV